MSVELVTPGHSPPLDTLITLGIVTGIFQAHSTAHVAVRKQGISYRITIDEQVEWGEVYAKLSERMLFEAERLRYGRGDLCSAFGPQAGIKFQELSEVFKEVVEKACDPFLRITLEYAEGSQHAAREGRGKKRKELRTAYLPVAPWAGKYFAGTYKYREEAYTLCPVCTFLAWSGLLSSSVITYKAENKRGAIYAVPDPMRVRGYDLALLALVFREKKEWIPNDIPLLAAPLLVLASGETVWPVEGEYGLYVWKYEGSGAFLGIRGFSQLSLMPLLEFVARAKAEGKYLARLVRYLAGKERGDPSLIAQITECLVYGDPDPYTVVRNVWSLLVRSEKGEKRGERTKWLERSFVDALFRVWRRYWRGHRAGCTPSSAKTVAGTGSWT
jgi:hypothetical protein